jgi:hypothetical protein
LLDMLRLVLEVVKLITLDTMKYTHL